MGCGGGGVSKKGKRYNYSSLAATSSEHSLISFNELPPCHAYRPKLASRNALLIICNLLWFQLPLLLPLLLLLQLAECRLSAFTCCTLIENIMGVGSCCLWGWGVGAANRCCCCGCWCFFLHFLCLKSFSVSAVFIKSFMVGQLNMQLIHPLGKAHKHTHTHK